jgi:hypothetical protein
MSTRASSWFLVLKKILIVPVIVVGLYLFTFLVSRSVLNSLYMGIETSKATGLSAVAPPMLQLSHAYPSADSLLQPGWSNVVRAVSLALEVPSFDSLESRVVEISQQSNGFLEKLETQRRSDTSPWLEAKLRLPVKSLNAALTRIRGLGTIRQETEALEDTNAERDSLNAQLESKRTELARLNEIVRHRSGSLGDSVAAEEKLSERRKEAGDLEKRLKNLDSRVEYALVELQISEQYHARLDWRAAIISSDLSNSFIEGVDVVLSTVGAVLAFLLRYGLALIVWTGILYWPSRTLWRRYRRVQSLSSLAGV